MSDKEITGLVIGSFFLVIIIFQIIDFIVKE